MNYEKNDSLELLADVEARVRRWLRATADRDYPAVDAAVDEMNRARTERMCAFFGPQTLGI